MAVLGAFYTVVAHFSLNDADGGTQAALADEPAVDLGHDLR
jgi:hypothetical protein